MSRRGATVVACLFGALTLPLAAVPVAVGGVTAAGDLLWLAAITSFAVVGSFIAARRPDHRIGWVLAAIGLLALAQNAAWRVAAPAGASPSAGRLWAGWSAPGGFEPVLVLLFVVLPLLFPSGRLASRRAAAVLAIAAAAGTASMLLSALRPGLLIDLPFENPAGVAPLGGVPRAANEALIAVVLVCGLLANGGVLLRFHRAVGEERLQLRWFVSALVLLLGYGAVSAVAGLVFASDRPELAVVHIAGPAIALALPVSAAVAVLRYRLYDIDRIVSRTVAWTVLSGVLVVVYLGVVLAAQTALPGAGDSPLAVASATLSAAALFQPARRRIQHVVDRRFNRAHYDAERVVEEFRVRLRNALALGDLDAEIRTTVQRTVAPTFVALWLRPTDGERT